ncbi:MAG: histidine kinase [Planctomycetota bacterium]
MSERLSLKYRISVYAISFSWCTLMAVLYATAYYESRKLMKEDVQWTSELVFALLRWWPCMIELTLILWCSRLFPLKRPLKARFVLAHFTASLVLAFADLGYDYFINTYCLGYRGWSWIGFGKILIECAYYWITLGFFLGIESFLKSRERAVQTSRLEAQLAQAQLQVLKMQFHPHFLFNTLHAAGTLMHRDIDGAERVLSRLSELLRQSMDQVGPQEVCLKKELDFLNLYLDIERIRFQDRLEVQTAIPGETLSAYVPNLILLPIVEDAIHHGISRNAGRGRIDLRSYQKNGTLCIDVWNSGSNRDDHDGSSSKRMGLDSAEARLKQLYGEKGKIEIRTPDEGGLTVQVCIPFHTVPAE